MDMMMKKNMRITMVSCKRGIAEKSALIRTFKPLTLEIVFKGLSTRKALNAPTLMDDSSTSPSSSYSSIGISTVPADKNTSGKLVVTITKSRMFQESLMYAFSLK